MTSNNTGVFEQIDTLIADGHGNLRGNRFPGKQASKISSGEVRLPLSTRAQDIWNEDMDNLVGPGLSKGDPDGLCIPGDGNIIPQPWHTSNGQIIVGARSADATLEHGVASGGVNALFDAGCHAGNGQR